MIPYGHQSISDDDIEAVVRVLRSALITQGPAVEAFEEAFAAHCGAKHAVAVANGTAALHLACLALGLGPGDVLWTSPNTFLASANCARLCGADVDFVDIDPRTYDLDAGALERKLRAVEETSLADGGEASRTAGTGARLPRGRLPLVVVPVHFAGRSCDMAPIRELSERYGFFVLEDATHALGGRYKGGAVCSCAYSHVAVFSFHAVKAITTGEGGMVVTNDGGLAERIRILRAHGVTRDPARMRRKPDGPWYYEQVALGPNYRLTDFQSALGTSQLQRLDDFIDRRNELAERYDRLLAELPLEVPARDPNIHSAYHLYVVRLRTQSGGPTKRQVFDALRAADIGAQVHYIPVHLQPYYRDLGFSPGDFPEAERYYEEALTLPLYPALTEREQDRIVEVLRDAFTGRGSVPGSGPTPGGIRDGGRGPCGDSDNPHFSVVMPALNAASFIGEAIDSVRAQSFQDWELIVVDDGSTDATLSVATSKAALDSRIRVFKVDTPGRHLARIVAPRHAQAPWLARLDADDLMKPTYLERMAQFIRANPGYDIYSCNGVVFGPHTVAAEAPDSAGTGLYYRGRGYRRVRSASANDMLRGCPIFGMAVIRRATYESVGGIREASFQGDYDLWLRALLSGARHLHDPEVLGWYRQSAGQMSKDHARMRAGIAEILGNILADPALTEKQRELAGARLARTRMMAAMAAGDYRHARRNHWKCRMEYLDPTKYYLSWPLMLLSPKLFQRAWRRHAARRTSSLDDSGPQAVEGRPATGQPQSSAHRRP